MRDVIGVRREYSSEYCADGCPMLGSDPKSDEWAWICYAFNGVTLSYCGNGLVMRCEGCLGTPGVPEEDFE